MSDQPIESLRSQMTEAAKSIPGVETLIGIVADACQVKRKVRVIGWRCQKCGTGCQHHQVFEIDDAKAAMEALRFVMEQTEGRPGVAEAGEAGVVVIRQIVGVNE